MNLIDARIYTLESSSLRGREIMPFVWSRETKCEKYLLPDIISSSKLVESKSGLERRYPVKLKAAHAMSEFLKDDRAKILILHEDDSYLCRWAWLCLCLWRRLYYAGDSEVPFVGRLTVTMWVNYYNVISPGEFGEYPDSGLSCQMVAFNRSACKGILNANKHLLPGSFDIFTQHASSERWCIYPHICQHSALRSTWNKLPRHKSRYFNMNYRPGIPSWLVSCVPDVNHAVLYGVVVALAYFDYLAIPDWSLEKSTIMGTAEAVARLYKKQCTVVHSSMWNIAMCEEVPVKYHEGEAVVIVKRDAVTNLDGWIEMMQFGEWSVLYWRVNA